MNYDKGADRQNLHPVVADTWYWFAVRAYAYVLK